MFNLKDIELEIKNYKNDLDKKISKVEEVDFSELKDMLSKIKADFNKKVDDFFANERQLRIAVIGQVKAGKSTFLNNLLFDGNDILPRAATPKTATLTVIKYAKENSIELDFYTKEEWKELEKLSVRDEEADDIKVAKEIMKMVKVSNLNVSEYIGNSNFKLTFGNYEELIGKLNEYVGENGKYTPIVKSLVMNLNNENIKDIEIIDTPGLNDPIVARTDKTRQFIGMCDVVFFLSQASSFLDKTDIDLLFSQLPQNGVKKMILASSKYDSALMDVIWEVESFEEAEEAVKTSLTKVAKRNFDEKLKNLDENSNLRKTIEESQKPIFISSMANNMSKKSFDDFNDEEQNIYENLCEHNELTREDLKNVGNFTELEREFNKVVDIREKILIEKSETFIPVSKEVLKTDLTKLKETLEAKNNIIMNNDINDLSKVKSQISTKSNNIRNGVSAVVDGTVSLINQNSRDVITSIKYSMNEYSRIDDRHGVDIEEKSYTVSTSKWYKPWTWGKTETEYRTVEKRYTYLDVNDAIENIRMYTDGATQSIERTFNKSIKITTLKKQIISVILENFDTDSLDFDPLYIRSIVESKLDTVEIPELELDMTSYLSGLISKFGSEIRGNSEKQELRTMLTKVISDIYGEMRKVFEENVASIVKSLKEINTSATTEILKDLDKEVDKLLEEIQNREIEVVKNNKNLELITELIEK